LEKRKSGELAKVNRSRFQGTWNIIRFNWPFYVLSAALLFLVVFIHNYVAGPLHIAIDILLVLTVLSTLVSLIVSWYVYDHSNLYALDWLGDLPVNGTDRVININTGFDETTCLLSEKFSGIDITVLDFYDPQKHTAPSIKRARAAYPPLPGTRKVSTGAIALDDGSADKIFAIMSAHEIRDPHEREIFFKELDRLLASNGQIIVVEHLRDTANMLAYNVGAFHFHTRAKWLKAFKAGQLKIDREIKITPFITAFFLIKDGNTS
jgi:hypothetical protein